LNNSCVFCRIVSHREPADVIRQWSYAIAIKPLNPVTEGHVLVIPRIHVTDVTSNAYISGRTMRAAAEIATAPCNIITSAGAEATQTVQHLHLHVVPRRENDGLLLPWSAAAEK
jgi:histidine triad (HIT) family protein